MIAAMTTTALAHFSARLAFETDCDDVARALASGEPDFVLVDARGPDAYEAGHLPGAYNLIRPIGAEDLSGLPDLPLVVYCWGPGCNGAVKAALQLARLGRSVKEMLGGFEYWVREGHPIEGRDAEALAKGVDTVGLVKMRDAVSCLC
jgi:rhodanese-related sulfurtransferase